MVIDPNAPIQHYTVYGSKLGGYWMNALSWVAYHFAQIEWVSYQVVLALVDPAEKKAAIKDLWTARLKRARELMATHLVNDPALAAEWAAFWDAAAAVAKRRNDVLHNPLMNDFREIDAATENDGILLVKEDPQRVMKLGEVQAISDEISKVRLKGIDLLKRTALPA